MSMDNKDLDSPRGLTRREANDMDRGPDTGVAILDVQHRLLRLHASETSLQQSRRHLHDLELDLRSLVIYL